MTRTKRRDHIDTEEVLTIAGGASPSAATRTHIERCAPCRSSIAEAEELISDLRAGGLNEPGPALVQRTIGLFPERPPLAERVVESLARLVRGGDSYALATEGLRGASAAPARLLFEGPGLEIDVELVAARGSYQVTGQVLHDGPPTTSMPLLAWAESGGCQVSEAPVSGLGAFVLDRVPAKAFDLVLDFGASRLRLPVSRVAET